MNKLVDWLDKLRTDLDNNPNIRQIKLDLFNVNPDNARAAVEDAIKAVRGEVTAEDRDVLGQISSSQLIQLLIAGMGRQFFDIPPVFSRPALSPAARANIAERLAQARQKDEHARLLDSIGPTTPEAQRAETERLLDGVKPTDIYEAGLQAAAKQVQDGDRSAGRSSIRTATGEYKNNLEAEREARQFKRFKELFFAAAAKPVPLNTQIEITPSGIKFVVADVTGANIKKALDTGVHGLIGGKRLHEVIKEDEWASRFFLLRGDVDGKLVSGVQPEHPAGLLDYTSIFTLIDTPEGYGDKFLYVIASQGVHRTEKKES